MRRSSSSRKTSADKPKPKPFGLDSEALLAKIDSLDWEDPTIQPQAAPSATAAEPPPTKHTLLFAFVAGFVVLLVGMVALRYYGDSGERTAPTPTVAVADEPAAAPAPVEAPSVATPVEEASSAHEPVPLTVAEQAEKEKLEKARRHRAELRRRALAAKRALAEKHRRARAEQERLRAERAAAEARAKAAAAAAPKGPSSPQEVCAGEEGAFAVSACETRACAQAKWRNHPFCVKRWRNELRKLSPSSFGG